MLVLAVLGCTPPVEDLWTPRRQTCGLAPGEVHAYPTASLEAEDVVVYDETCARAIGDDLGMLWEELPPADLPGSPRGSVVEKAIGGAWLYLAGDFGTVGDLLADPDAPAQLVDELAGVQRAVGAADDDPASRVLYDWIAHYVEVTRPRDENVVGFEREDGALLPWDMPAEAAASPWGWVSYLAHEVWHHRTDASHVDCHTGELVRGGRDDDWNSAYGVGLYLVVRLVDRLPEDVASALAQEVFTAWHSGHFCRGTELPDRYRVGPP